MVTLGEDEGGDGCCGGLRGDVSNDLEPTSLVGPRRFCLYLCISMEEHELGGRRQYQDHYEYQFYCDPDHFFTYHAHHIAVVFIMRVVVKGQ
eukprot:scaffold228_cov56-Cyclotella_meneghiniana.AAC.7